MITLIVVLCAVIFLMLGVIALLLTIVMFQKKELEPLDPPVKCWEDAEFYVEK